MPALGRKPPWRLGAPRRGMRLGAQSAEGSHYELFALDGGNPNQKRTPRASKQCAPLRAVFCSDAPAIRRLFDELECLLTGTSAPKH